MEITVDPFEPIVAEGELNVFAELTRRPALAASSVPSGLQAGVTVARFAGFDLQEQPLVADLACLPGQVVPSRSTIALRREMVGAQVVLMFEGGKPERPIILGVIHQKDAASALPATQAPLHAQVDEERVVFSAEREIVLRCGDASITLTRAGKVIIKGNYIISRSTGYNKIKGAAIDIN